MCNGWNLNNKTVCVGEARQGKKVGIGGQLKTHVICREGWRESWPTVTQLGEGLVGSGSRLQTDSIHYYDYDYYDYYMT